MSTSIDDHLLLRRYAETGSEEAFAELVQRHLNHVFSVAAREVGEPHLAADLAQAAFILLARKAGSVRARESLSGWLFHTVRFAARNARRAARRREHYEREAAEMNALYTASEPDAGWDRLVPLLNDGLDSLSVRDRNLVTLRFFEKKSHADIAAWLDVPEASARKRLSRAIERLRRFFARRGVSVTGASLVTMLLTQSVSAAPPGLAGTVTAAALAQGAGAAAAVAGWVKSGLSALAWAKLKLAGSISAGVALVLGALAFEFAGAPDGEGATGFVFRDIQFTNRFVDHAQGGEFPTADGRPHLFVRTTQRSRGLGFLSRVLGRRGEVGVVPSPVVLQVADERDDFIEGAFMRRSSVTVDSQDDLWEVPFFPRRGTELWLRLFDRNLQQLAARRVANPAFADGPELPFEPLPATSRDGGLAVRLEEFVSGPRTGAGKFPRRQTTLTFSLSEDGGAAPFWAVRSIQAADATGNLWQELRPATQLLPGAEARFQCRLYYALWPGEPAWQVELELVRTNQFDPADMLTLPELAVPPANLETPLNQDLLLNGHPVRLRSLSGPQPGSASDPAQPPGHLVLTLDAPGMGADWRPGIVEAYDDRGQPWSVTDYHRNGTRVLFRLHGPAGAQALTLKLARQELRRVSFVARLTKGSPAGAQGQSLQL